MKANPKGRSDVAREASRLNGARSRGPKTTAGKARSLANATKHGLRSARPPEVENLPAWLLDLESELCALSEPVDQQARALIDAALAASWRLQRAETMIDELMSELLNPRYTEATTVDPLEGDILEVFEAALVRFDLKDIHKNMRAIQMALRPSARFSQPKQVKSPDWQSLMVLLRYEIRFRGQRDRALRKLLQRR